MSVLRTRSRAARRRRLVGLTVACVVAAVALGACGGSAQKPPATSTGRHPGSGASTPLTIRPGVGLGSIVLGESRMEIQTHLRVARHPVRSEYVYDTPGGRVTVTFDPQGRASIISSSSDALALFGSNLGAQRSRVVRRMRAEGWTLMRCAGSMLVATRKAPVSGQITRIVWPSAKLDPTASPSATVYPAQRLFPGEFGCPAGAGSRRPL